MILGLTGFSGAGKSTVAAILKEHGFYHLDCDALVHCEVYSDPNVLQALSKVFGNHIVADGTLDRIALRHCVMGDADALDTLNRTVRPYILSYIEKHLRQHADENVILDAPLLFESGLEKRCDKVLSIIAQPDLAMKRIIARDSLSKEDAERRLKSQHSAEFYAERSDFVVYNDGDLQSLKNQIESILSTLYAQEH